MLPRRCRERVARETRVKALEQALACELVEARYLERECTVSSKISATGARWRTAAAYRREELWWGAPRVGGDRRSFASALPETLRLRGEREAALAESRNLLEALRPVAARWRRDCQRLSTLPRCSGEWVADLRLKVGRRLTRPVPLRSAPEEAHDEAASPPPLTPGHQRSCSLQRRGRATGREIAELGPSTSRRFDELEARRSANLPGYPD